MQLKFTNPQMFATRIKARVFKMAVMAVAFMTTLPANAQFSKAGDYTQGTTALGTVAEQIAKYVPYVVNLCYALAAVVALVGSISVYVSMTNDDQDVKKKIMMLVGACIFLIAAAQALPLFFLTSTD